MDNVDWNTAIASIGAIAGVSALLWNIIRDQIGGKVGLNHFITFYDKEHSEEGVSVTFINRGKQNIKLEEINFLSAVSVRGFIIKILKLNRIGCKIPNMTKGFVNWETFDLPKWVVPNDSVTFLITQAHITKLKERPKIVTDKLKYICVRDATDKYYRMKISNSIRKELFGKEKENVSKEGKPTGSNEITLKDIEEHLKRQDRQMAGTQWQFPFTLGLSAMSVGLTWIIATTPRTPGDFKSGLFVFSIGVLIILLSLFYRYRKKF